MPRHHLKERSSSINHKTVLSDAGVTTPDFRNLGVMLRILVVVHLCAFATVVVSAADIAQWIDQLVLLMAQIEMPLLIILLFLYIFAPWLKVMKRRGCVVFILSASILVVLAVRSWGQVSALPQTWRVLLWTVAVVGICLLYFDYRGLKLSPALAEARVMALTARIRPHFLFNALNGILGVIRTDSRRAEYAIEELSELFRVLMQENRELVPLHKEVALCERYVALESLRLGDRLKVRWSLERCPKNALVPPLMLQPLLENAVYHGIEPLSKPGEIVVRGRLKRNEIFLQVENPLSAVAGHVGGNRMAISNIKERLALFFDLEARMETEIKADKYRVTIRFPYRRSQQ